MAVLIHLLVHRADGHKFAERRTLSRVPCVGEHVSFPSSHPRHEEDVRVYRVTDVLLFDLDGRANEPGPVAEVWARQAEEPGHRQTDPKLSCPPQEPAGSSEGRSAASARRLRRFS